MNGSARRAEIRVGISGWTYPPWRGVFYPPGLRQRDELGYAADRLGSIEVNGPFYALQRPSSFRSWREQIPDDLVLSVKGGRQANRASLWPAISADGKYMAFHARASNLVAGDTNDRADVFVRDRMAGETWRVSVGSDGRQANRASSEPAISADGRHVAFRSFASNLVAGDTNCCFADVFVRVRGPR